MIFNLEKSLSKKALFLQKCLYLINIKAMDIILMNITELYNFLCFLHKPILVMVYAKGVSPIDMSCI